MNPRPADTKDNPIEEQQGIPLSTGHLVEDIEGRDVPDLIRALVVASLPPMMAHPQIEAE
jgi:hypothetical protein